MRKLNIKCLKSLGNYEEYAMLMERLGFLKIEEKSERELALSLWRYMKGEEEGCVKVDMILIILTAI